ncbi:hypothetical protein RJ55_07159 [Drechmeria coniospora]|nr:hypothetical protein RJ55_07159 [Drechmeria coniospora]
MAEIKTETKTLEAKCLCGSVHLTFDIPVALLPLPVYLCHCSLCRYATGSPCVFHTQLPEGLLPSFVGESGEDKMTSWVSRGAGCSYDFCSTCGCHIAGVGLDRNQWTPATSIFSDHGGANFIIDRHVFSKSAKGGGLSSMLTHLGRREMPCWNPANDDPAGQLVEAQAEMGDDGESRLRAECKCGGVSFAIRRPNQAVLDDDVMSRCVSPKAKEKWMAEHDVCDDCRLTSGTHVVGWAKVPLALCEPAIDTGLRVGTSKTFASSEGVLRAFCGVCGATVFRCSVTHRPTEGQAVVDVATGILRAPEGVLAENWLTWKSRLAFAASGMAYDVEFAEALSKGMQAWAEQRYGVEES